MKKLVLFYFILITLCFSQPLEKFTIKSTLLDQAEKIDITFKSFYKPNWMGAYGLIGEAYLYKITHDEKYLDFINSSQTLIKLENGIWTDDTAWACLAILHWWDATGRTNQQWLKNVESRYKHSKNRKLISNEKGYWTWFNIPKRMFNSYKRFTNGNMNQMVSVACWLYIATKNKEYLNDALLIWNGDSKFKGIEKQLYKGNGKWQGQPGPAAEGAEIPFNGAEYASISSFLFKATGEQKYKKIAIDTVKYIMNPENNWIDKDNYYQKYVDGNGAFLNFIFDAYDIAKTELNDIPQKCRITLKYVWSNGNSKSRVPLHREEDNGIRHGWNITGGEDGYFPNDIGTLLSQAEALRAWGITAYYTECP